MSLKYNEYLHEHCSGVRKGLQWMTDNLAGIDHDILDKAMSNAEVHDNSKMQPEEYKAYDDYFYGGNKTAKVKEAFDYAWLHHIHNNPHHWQYWVLINDDASEGTRALEMPLEYVYEMIADWWSFSWKKGNLMEIFDWYDDHKKRIIFHKNTKKVVEMTLDYIRSILKMQQRKEQPSKLEDEDETVEEVKLGDDYLAHHGIQGQHWGVRNGPPYPLNAPAKLNTVRNLNDEMNSKWEYGVLHNGQHIIDTEDFNWGKDYRTTPIDILKKEKIGVCWDFVNYQHDALKNMGIKDESYMLTLQKSDDPNDIVTHTFTTFDMDGKKYWMESAAWPKRGVHEITGYKDVVNELNDMYGNPGKGISVFKYNPDGLDKGLTDTEFFDRATQDLVLNIDKDDHLAHHGVQERDADQ